jgi:MraZ protein
MAFVGTFEHSLDEKGRVVLPAVFRARLAGGGVVTKADRCLAVWTAEEFENVSGALVERMKRGEADREVVRSFAADAHEFSPDGQGRIVIPQRLRDFAGLGRDVVVNGAIDRIEVWDGDRWNDVNRTGEQRLGQEGYRLADLGI